MSREKSSDNKDTIRQELSQALFVEASHLMKRRALFATSVHDSPWPSLQLYLRRARVSMQESDCVGKSNLR
jgi:hypothetical protein